MLIIIGVAVVLLAAKGFSDWQTAKTVKGESVRLPTQLVVDKLEEVGQDVLGRAVEILPGSKELKEKIVEKETEKTQTAQTEATKIIETQTKEIIEIIKQLPQEQVNQIKKQVFKDFCQEVLKE